MHIDLELRNLDQDLVTIEEISITNPAGLHSSIATADRMSIAANDNVAFDTTFNHVSDKKLFQATALHGLIDSCYTISVLYRVAGKENMRVVRLQSKLPAETFASYRDSNAVYVHTYVINMNESYVENQIQFLANKRIATTSEFVHVTEQELALAGLNFRISAYHAVDSLHLELFVVNHSEMELTIDTSKLDIFGDDVPVRLSGFTYTINKVTGQKDAPTIVAKGDRVIVRARGKLQEAPEHLSIGVVNSIKLRNRQKLFQSDLDLVRAGRIATDI